MSLNVPPAELWRGYDAASLCLTASVALVIYDHITTLFEEVEHIYYAKFSAVTLLFIMNRIALFAWSVAGLYLNFCFVGPSEVDLVVHGYPLTISCTISQGLFDASTMVLIVIQAAFIALRIYAFSGGQLVVSVVILLLGASGVCGQMGFTTGSHPRFSLPGSLSVSCYTFGSFWIVGNYESLKLVSLVGSVVSALADLGTIIITWNKVRAAARLSGRVEIDQSVSTILLRDGIVHFVTLLVLNSLSFANGTRDSSPAMFKAMSTLMQFQTPLRALTVSHFLLNLRGAACLIGVHVANTQLPYANPSTSDGPSSQQTSIRFAPFLAPLGGSLTFASLEEEEGVLDIVSKSVGDDETERLLP